MSNVVDVLYESLGALPSEKFGVINLLPWAVESDQTNELKREVAECIAAVLREHGFIANPDDTTRQPAPAQVNLNCRMCSKTLTTVSADNGIVNLPAASFITDIARMRPECPHETISMDDQRRAIQEAVIASMSE